MFCIKIISKEVFGNILKDISFDIMKGDIISIVVHDATDTFIYYEEEVLND